MQQDMESREIARTVGIDIPMTRYFEEALVTEMQPPMFEQMLGTADADFYGHQTVHGSFVFGSESGLEEAADMEPADLRTSALTMSAGCRAIIGYIPAPERCQDRKKLGRMAGYVY